MKRTSTLLLVTAILMALGLQSCLIETTSPNVPGPNGRPGNAFYGITYEVQHPYSYWDNNPAIPIDPEIGFYFPTAPGLYDFEYFINPTEYWYGTYETFINLGGRGGSYGRPGPDGPDTYLMLVCDPMGYYEIRGNYKTSGGDGTTQPLVVESHDEMNRFRITMQKATISERPAQQPKATWDPNLQ